MINSPKGITQLLQLETQQKILEIEIRINNKIILFVYYVYIAGQLH